ncbi:MULTISPECIES: hypothetical protein [unclassified Streptococcus]|uniref:hypothetical protein n=1 Tax=unclassified Streptococcus TaxID=2608887 RepID=UPI001072DF4E|nr:MULTISPECIES: hypothetical protein [unclassified Streptococcus]MBF0786697.1 hypothetical protein [Streptococcus sp. 19428wC2_LYSM12]MCQ9211694.1 hypothetical protein [Streptococcus sp. B01]MCQ9213117.1 hypothetical protein [Streptococcus sp. O1]TFV06449.1 hypothetical protein E4T79_02000 [Streptococcus sp. LYSM12]
MIDETQTVHLRDLRNLGKQGGATARLEDGTELILKPDYAVKKARGYVDGILRDVEFHLPYKSIYSHIRTIKKDNHLVARKTRSPAGFVLRLTGKGYQSPSYRTNKQKGN